jgi:hypothetical protein
MGGIKVSSVGEGSSETIHHRRRRVAEVGTFDIIVIFGFSDSYLTSNIGLAKLDF